MARGSARLSVFVFLILKIISVFRLNVDQVQTSKSQHIAYFSQFITAGSSCHSSEWSVRLVKPVRMFKDFSASRPRTRIRQIISQ